MNNNINSIEQLSKTLTQLAQQLKQSESILPIDIAVLKQKCTELYEHILLLNHDTKQSAINIEVEENKPIEGNQLPITPSQVFIPDLIMEEKNDILQPVLVDTDIVKTETELQNEAIDTIIEQQQSIEHTNPVVLIKEVINELSLHEKIANSHLASLSLSDKLSATIPSLKAAINVNLKIAIVNDLFKENTVEYVKAIDKLNASDSIHEAMRYFNELKNEYLWENDNPLSKELELLIEKRFS